MIHVCRSDALATSAGIAQLEEHQDLYHRVAGSITLCATIFLPTKFTSWHTSLKLKICTQNVRSVKNQIRVYWFETRVIFYRVLDGCSNRIGPALTSMHIALHNPNTTNIFVILSCSWRCRRINESNGECSFVTVLFFYVCLLMPLSWLYYPFPVHSVF